MKKFLARLFFKLIGWKTAGTVPPLKKFVLIAAPHTSALDFPIGMCGKYIFDVNFTFFGKKELFDGPFGFLFRWLGGIGVDRSANRNMVDQAVQMFSERDEFILALAPEGTRAYAPQWRTGFYRIAEKAGVPVVMGYIDFATKTVGVGPAFYPTGNMEKDIEAIKNFYRQFKGRHPEKGVL